MINVGRVLYNPKFAQLFTVHRKPGSWVAGRWVPGTEQTLTFYGVVVPVSPKELMQLPEGDRVTGMMAFYSTSEIFSTHTDGTPGTSDEIEWKGKRYRVVNVNLYVDYGFYCAYAVYMAGD